MIFTVGILYTQKIHHEAQPFQVLIRGKFQEIHGVNSHASWYRD